jgi:iron complex outermembrane receptor protein
MTARSWKWVFPALALLALGTPLAAQTGTIIGRIIEAGGDRPIAGVNVAAFRDGGTLTSGRAVSGANGVYRITGVTVGTYRIRVSLIGYGPMTREGVAVAEGATATVDFELAPQAAVLQEVEVYSVSRRVEKEIDAPASVTVIQTTELAERPAMTVTDHLKGVPGVDISQGGLMQSNVVARGFNNIFSGSLLTLTDNRFASVPSLRVNIPAFVPGTGEDLERLEFVLGPGAALYGPYSSSGVLNVVTKSPLDYRGTTISLEGGIRSKSPLASGPLGDQSFERFDDAGSLWRISGRHSTAFSETFGVKISGEYFRGDDWRFVDPNESARATVAGCGETCRDFDIEKYSFDVRADYRPDQDLTVVANYGNSNAKNLVELTGLGAGQVRGWIYQYAQARARFKRFFVQAFGNFSDAGETILLQSGEPLVDRSRLWAGQVQQGLDIGQRSTLLFGADYIYTDSRTDGTINGVYEDIDGIKEWGGYVHTVTPLTSALELTAALRADGHNFVEGTKISPRVALVFKATENQSLRLTYNRAHSNPTALNLFLDIPGGTSGPYTVRAVGVPTGGFSFRGGDCPAGGVDNLCMRTPFPGAPTTLLPANAASLWSVAVGALQQAGAIDAQTAAFLNSAQVRPTPAQVGTELRILDPATRTFTTVGAGSVRDIAQIAPTTTNALEFGYKAVLGGKARLSVDLWWENKENFIGPLIVESPNVFLNRAETIAHLTPFVGAQTAAALGTGMAGISGTTGATLGVPLATVVPHNAAVTDRADIFLTYRNFGEVDLLGTDIALDYVLSNYFSVASTVSLTNKDYYTRDEVRREGETEGFSDIALNAPKAKGSVTGRFRNERTGWSAEARYRAVKGFPINSGVWSTGVNEDGSRETIPSYGVLDAQVSYRLPVGGRTMLMTLSATNLLDKPYQTFTGVPNLGRTIVSKVTYTF